MPGDCQPPCRLSILIVGCGIGGLSAAHCLSQAGHSVTIIESAGFASEIGAGIQLSPNATRLLIRWGLGDKLSQAGVEPDRVVFRRYENGDMIGCRYFGESMERVFGAPYYNVHRADLHSMLYTLAASSPQINFRIDSKVVEINPTPNPRVSVTLASGEILFGDLVVGADGLKSAARDIVLGHRHAAIPTGDAAYRAVIRTDVFDAEEDLKALVDRRETTVWMGPMRHVVGYCIRARREYNLVMIHPDTGSVESWSSEGDIETMREEFKDFEPRIIKIMSHVDRALKWRLMEREPLSTWVHSENRVVLLGDSCHPMLPYHAQGAAMAIEDSAVLGSVLSRLAEISDLGNLLRSYEQLRKPRTSKTQAASRTNRTLFHLPDGPLQRDRDAELRKTMETGRQQESATHSQGDQELGKESEAVSSKADELQRFIADQYAYDAEREVERWWSEHMENSDKD
ncbi:hypothetical protein ACEPAF_301 [Sanghuangporus sanghuang]